MRGMKQGDVFSPVILSLFINELDLDIINNGKHSVSFSIFSFFFFFKLFILLFADDIILFSEADRFTNPAQ